MDLYAIGQAIAAQFTGVTTADGEALNVLADGLLPNTVGAGPDLLVYPPEGEVSLGLGPTVEDVYLYPVRLLFDPVHVPERHKRLLRWGTVMRDRVERNMDLGLAYVQFARAVSMRLEIEGQDYGGVSFDVVELVIRVQVRELNANIAV